MSEQQIIEIMARAAVESTSGPFDMLSPDGKRAALYEARASLSALREAGFAIVPREPTVAQLRAGQDAWLKDPQRRSSTLYAAMIAASQEPTI